MKEKFDDGPSQKKESNIERLLRLRDEVEKVVKERIIHIEKQRSFSDEDARRVIERNIDIKSLSEKLHPPFNQKQVIENFAHLLLEIKERLPEYDTIISDEASGRNVALFVHKIASKLAESSDPDKKRVSTRKPQIYFLNLGRASMTADHVRDFLEIKNSRNELGATLVVSEFISKGMTSMQWLKLFKRIGFHPDFATLEIEEKPQKLYKSDMGRAETPAELNNDTAYEFFMNLKYGGVDRGHLFGQPTGVRKIHSWKHDTEDLKDFDETFDPDAGEDYKKFRPAFPLVDKDVDPSVVKQQREDVKLLADELFKLVS